MNRTTTAIERLTKPEEYAIVGIITIIFSVGSLGNLAICFVYKKVQLLPRLSSKLIINLAICDVLLCLHTGFMVHGLLSGPTGGPSRLLCDVSGYIRFVLTFVSFAAVTLIMVKRYCNVVLLDRKHFFSYLKINITIAIPWLYHMCLGVAPLFGWSHYTFSYGKLACTCRIKTSVSFSALVSITSMLGPLVILLFCSAKIFEKLKEMRKFAKQDEPNVPRMRKRDEIRGSIILFGVIINYFVCAVPFIILNLLEACMKDFTIPLRADIATSIITQLMPVINPIIFGFGNEKFRKAFRKVVKKKRRRRVHPVFIKEIKRKVENKGTSSIIGQKYKESQNC